MKVRLAVWLVFAMSSFCATVADAVVTPVAGAIEPVDDHTSVVLEKMMVSVELYSDRAEVDSTFLLHNTGDATSVAVTFPEAGELGVATGQIMSPGRLTLWADGDRLSSNGGSTGPEAYVVWDLVRFAPDERRVVRVRYDTALATGPDGRRFFEYVIGSAAAWKGTIHHCGITVDVHYEDRAHECFNAPYSRGSRFSREDFEPASNEQFRAWYSRAPVGATVAGYPLGCEMKGGHLVLRDGRLWVAVRRLAEWLHVHFRPLPGGVRLTRGGRVVTLMSGDAGLDLNGSRSPLPEAPRIEQGRLMAPLRPLASALGATVQWRPQTQRVEVRFPVEGAFRRAFTPEEHQWYSPRLPRHAWPLGWAPLEMGEYEQNALAEPLSRGSVTPVMVAGDFAPGSLKDIALLLQRGDEYGLAVLKNRSGGFEFLWLYQWRRDAADPADSSVMLRSRARGKVAYELGEPASKLGRFRLDRDGIELVADGRPTMLFFWDEAVEGRNRFRSVVIAE